MKRIICTLIVLVSAVAFANAQWNTVSTVTSTSNTVGIGTNAPTEQLHVVGSLRMSGSGRKIVVGTEGSVNDYLLIQDIGSGNPALQWVQDGSAKFTIEGVTGNVGIGVAAPTEQVHMNGNIRMSGSGRKIVVGSEGSVSDYLLIQDIGSGSPAFQWVQDGSPKFTIDGVTGNVGIGTTHPTQKLEVNGTLYSKEVRVDLSAGSGPDYVFGTDYNLLPLDELQAFIDQNKHLPEVPSAKEMEENGLYLKEMNLLLLKKVEELTLYLLEERKSTQELKAVFECQQREIEALKKAR